MFIHWNNTMNHALSIMEADGTILLTDMNSDFRQISKANLRFLELETLPFAGTFVNEPYIAPNGSVFIYIYFKNQMTL